MLALGAQQWIGKTLAKYLAPDHPDFLQMKLFFLHGALAHDDGSVIRSSVPETGSVPSLTNVRFCGAGGLRGENSDCRSGAELERRFGARADVQLVVNVPQMPPHGAIRQT